MDAFIPPPLQSGKENVGAAKKRMI